MKKFTTIIAALAITVATFAQAPEKMSYQAVVRNSSNELVSNQQVGMQVSILQSSEDGTVVYAETQTPTSNANGLVSIQIGSGTVVSGDFTTIDWANGPYFIKTETDVEGGTNYTITGTRQLLSVPYALHAKTADNTFSGDYNDLSNAPEIPVVDTLVSQKALQDSIATLKSEMFSGSYNDLTDTPEIPNVEELATQQALEDTAANIRADMFSGDYNDLSNTPDIDQSYLDELLDRINSMEMVLIDSGLIIITDVTDVDGNVYDVVRLGEQFWMAENLKTTRYNDGTEIPLVTDNTEWYNLTTPAYCWYDNDSATYAEDYGAYYNGYSVLTEKLCPVGWHVSTADDWTIMIEYLGGSDVAGDKLKESGTAYWSADNGTNESGFNARGGGFRRYDTGEFYAMKTFGSFHTSSTVINHNKLMQYAVSIYATTYTVGASGTSYPSMGKSVRCVKD